MLFEPLLMSYLHNDIQRSPSIMKILLSRSPNKSIPSNSFVVHWVTKVSRCNMCEIIRINSDHRAKVTEIFVSAIVLCIGTHRAPFAPKFLWPIVHWDCRYSFLKAQENPAVKEKQKPYVRFEWEGFWFLQSATKQTPPFTCWESSPLTRFRQIFIRI